MTFPRGKRVIYIPNHANGDRNHPDCKHGAVKSAGKGTTVYVLYDYAAVPHMTGNEDYTAQGTNIGDLVHE
jgi:hypothetical protein